MDTERKSNPLKPGWSLGTLFSPPPDSDIEMRPGKAAWGRGNAPRVFGEIMHLPQCQEPPADVCLQELPMPLSFYSSHSRAQS